MMSRTATTLLAIAWMMATFDVGHGEVGQMDWATEAEPSIVERNFSRAEIAEVVNGAVNDGSFTEESIGDFAWVKLSEEKRYLLAVSLAASRAFYNSLQLIESRNGHAVSRQTIDVWGLASFRDRVKDLDGDGQPELILPVKLDRGDYRGARPTAVWPAVYRLSAGRFADASNSFAAYYRHGVLPELEAKLSRAEDDLQKAGAKEDKDDLEQEIAATWMVHDKIMRVTGEQPNAGLERAKQWMRSSSPGLRKNAAAVFADMGKRTELQGLTTDRDPEVVEAAKRGLARSSADKRS